MGDLKDLANFIGQQNHEWHRKSRRTFENDLSRDQSSRTQQLVGQNLEPIAYRHRDDTHCRPLRPPSPLLLHAYSLHSRLLDFGRIFPLG